MNRASNDAAGSASGGVAYIESTANAVARRVRAVVYVVKRAAHRALIGTHGTGFTLKLTASTGGQGHGREDDEGVATECATTQN